MSEKPGNISIQATQQTQELLLWLKNEIDLGVAKLSQGDAEAAIKIFQRALEKTPAQMAAHDIISHNLMTAYKQSIELLLQNEAYPQINDHLKHIFLLQLTGEMALNPEFRSRFADTYYDLGKMFNRARQHEAALSCVRKAIAIQPCPSYYVDLTNALGFVKTPARLADYTQAYKPEQLGRHVFIACAPKSGSTFLKNVLVKLTQFKDMFSVYAALQNEHELDLPQLAKFGTLNTVTQQHCRATEANIHLMQAFGIRPVILVRNIFDTVISLLDFYKGGFTFSTFFDWEDFQQLDDEERIDLLIDYAVPWYFQFVASWQRAEREGRLSLHWLTYEQMICDKAEAIMSVLAFYQMAAKREDVQRVIGVIEADRRGNRFNQGVAGRGATSLSESQKERIRGLARHFPKTDFRYIGL